MVIKPYTNFHEPGIEFGLTYFDDPGVAVPSAVTTWVALRGLLSRNLEIFIIKLPLQNVLIIVYNCVVSLILGLPDFLIRMRQASKDYQKYKLMKQGAIASSGHLTLSEENVAKNQIEVDVEVKLKNDEKLIKDYNDQQDGSTNNTNELNLIHNVQQENENKDAATSSASREEQGLLHYFYLTKLFA